MSIATLGALIGFSILTAPLASADNGGKPVSPTHVSAYVGSQEADIVFTQSPNPPAAPILYYDVTALGSPRQSCRWYVTKLYGASQAGCSLYHLVNGHTYSILVTATNRYGTSRPSAPIHIVPSDTTDPPTNVKVSITAGVATITWSAPINTGGTPITKYQVWTTGSPSLICVTTKLFCTISGLKKNYPYSFNVDAYNSRGKGYGGNTVGPLTWQ